MYGNCNADVTRSEGCLEYALYCESFARSYPHDPAARRSVRDLTYFLNEAVRLEKCGL
jgi:hypothetical protein